MGYFLLDFMLPSHFWVSCALSRIMGIGSCRSDYLCHILGWMAPLSMMDVSKFSFHMMYRIVKLNYLVEKDLRNTRLKKFSEISESKSYSGFRQDYGLPVRGQRTHSNAKTCSKFSS